MTAQTDCWAAARTANSARRRERIEEFRQLTRDEGLIFTAVCARMHIDKTTATNYERVLIAETGVSALAHRQRLYAQTRQAGVSKRDAAARFGITFRTASNWERTLRTLRAVADA